MKCQHCKNDFSCKSNLVRHMRKYCSILNNGNKRKSDDYSSEDSPSKKQKCDTLPSTSGVNPIAGKICQHCGKLFSTSSNLYRHINRNCSALKNKNQTNEDHVMDTTSSTKYSVDRKKINRPIVSNLGNGVEKLSHAFKNRIASYRFTSPRTHIDYTDFMEEVKQKVFDIIKEYLQKHHTLKIIF